MVLTRPWSKDMYTIQYSCLGLFTLVGYGSVNFGLVHIAVQSPTEVGSPSFSLSYCNALAIHVASQKC